MTTATKTLQALDRSDYGDQESSYRKHLGASIIGRPCARQIWYIFYWALEVRHAAQRVRLFKRGHREEERLFSRLRRIGVTVYNVDAAGKQYRMAAHGGHFGGSFDGVGVGLPDLPPGTPAILECKTHNEDSFDSLRAKGLRDSKWEHYVQTVLYIDRFALEWGLYYAVDKNSDREHADIVQADPMTAAFYLERAAKIIASAQPPERISNKPSWWQCRMCDFKDICHDTAKPALNCRTCIHSQPVEGGWHCGKWGRPIPDALQVTGCTEHVYREGLWNFGTFKKTR